MSEAERGGDWLNWRAMVIGAAIAVVAGIGLSYVSKNPSAVAVMRGRAASAPALESPKGETVTPGQVVFVWRGSDEQTRLVVVDQSGGGKTVLDRVVPGEEYQPTPDEQRAFVASHRYHWYVERVDESGQGRPSSGAEFEVR